MPDKLCNLFVIVQGHTLALGTKFTSIQSLINKIRYSSCLKIENFCYFFLGGGGAFFKKKFIMPFYFYKKDKIFFFFFWGGGGLRLTKHLYCHYIIICIGRKKCEMKDTC